MPALLLAAPLDAQEAPQTNPETVTAEQVIADAKKVYSLPTGRAAAVRNCWSWTMSICP